MLQRLIYFIKYHNALPIALSVILLGSGAAFASSPQVRDAVVSEKTTVRSVDNSYIVATDLEAFNSGLKVTYIEEDDEFYYVTYEYKTIAVDDYVWKEKNIEEILAVSKSALGSRDLGTYVAKELGETVESKISYLKKAQGVENRKGITQKIATTEYSGLIGKFLSPKEETFEGYSPIKAEEKPFVASVEEGKQSAQIATANAVSSEVLSQIAANVPSREEIEKIIQKTVENILLKQKATAVTTTQTTSVTTTTGGSDAQQDTTAPVIVIAGNNPAEISVGDSYVDLGASVTDNLNENLGIHYSVNGVDVSNVNLDTSKDATHTIIYSSTDQAGNTGTAERVVVVGTGEELDEIIPEAPKDTTPPSITLVGESSVTLTEGELYTDAGATALDDIDGDITTNIVIVNSVNTEVVDDYTITYNVSDIAGNKASQVSRLVVVVSAPVQEQDVVDNTSSTTPETATTTSGQ